MTPESARQSRSPLSLAESLPFADVPGQTRLFLDYLNEPVSLRKYYPNAVSDILDLKDYSGHVLTSYQTDRKELCDGLQRSNLSLGAGSASLSNIDLLRRADTVAIVTGQQAGIFTGPLYTIYKALSAIALADLLRGNGIAAVPLFWVASEDHDIDEIDHASLLENGGRLDSVSYRPDNFVQGSSVGDIGLGPGIADVVKTAFERLPRTEFSEEMRAICSRSYSPDETYSSAFSRLLLALLGDLGLVVIDPLQPAMKQLASPIYAAAIERSDEIVTAIYQRGEELTANGYHAQVLVEQDYFPLFWHDKEGRRLALKHTGDGMYRIKGEKGQLHRDELLETAKTEPQRLSPGVMLRSVVQDYLLPTLCYYGGGAEVAYFAQNSEAYRVLDRPVTPILHRQSFTVIEPRESRNLERFGWTLVDLFRGKDAAVLEVAERDESSGLAAIFETSEKSIRTELQRIEQALAEGDPTLARSLDRRRQKILFHIETLRRKALRSEVARDETMQRRIDTLFESLLPHGSLQERELNVLTLLNKYGAGIIDWLYGCIDLNDKNHRVVNFK